MTTPEVVQLLSSVALVILTAFYVVYTNSLVRQSKRANDQSREAQEKQFRLLTLPHLRCTIREENGTPTITISNISAIPAYDVLLIAVGLYWNSELPISEFMAKYVEQRNRDFQLEAGELGRYGVSDEAVYPIFPAKKCVTSVLGFPPPTPDTIDVLLQYGDVLGTNYTQVYSFFNHTHSTAYKLWMLDQERLVPSPKVTRVFRDTEALETEDGQPLVGPGIGKFQDALKHSIPSAFTILPFTEPQEPGEWADI
jgi:hypothetical protein